jgi:hypothetical protein
MEPLDLGQVIERLVGELAPVAEAAGCTVTLRSKPGLIGSWDRGSLEQTLINVLGNAFKFGTGAPGGDGGNDLREEHGRSRRHLRDLTASQIHPGGDHGMKEPPRREDRQRRARTIVSPPAAQGRRSKPPKYCSWPKPARANKCSNSKR